MVLRQLHDNIWEFLYINDMASEIMLKGERNMILSQWGIAQNDKISEARYKIEQDDGLSLLNR